MTEKKKTRIKVPPLPEDINRFVIPGFGYTDKSIKAIRELVLDALEIAGSIDDVSKINKMEISGALKYITKLAMEKQSLFAPMLMKMIPQENRTEVDATFKVDSTLLLESKEKLQKLLDNKMKQITCDVVNDNINNTEEK